MSMKKIFFIAIPIILSFAGCSKGGGGNNNQPPCTSVSGVRATASATTIEKGQTLSFQTPVLSNVTFAWTIPGGTTVNAASGSVTNIDFANEGWYYLTATNTCSQTKKDSFYVDVTIPQGSATCTPAANSVSYTAAGHQSGTFTSIHQGESAVNTYEFIASGPTAGDFTIFFHSSYKNNNQPPDGVYTTGTFNANGLPSFGANDLDKVFVIMITYWPTTIYYRSTPGQKVYVSRTGGKMKVTICDMPMAGSSNGTPYSTNMTLSATEQ